jgi:AcrR family transcriptional regulator
MRLIRQVSYSHMARRLLTNPRNPPVASRKQPSQARAVALIDAILDAAIQVLMAEGAHRFTTARVAERAGVSVGSLYQYFPNKAAILFRLQSDEWRRTTALLRSILEDTDRPPLERVRILAHAFIASECEEAQIRIALGDAAPLYRDAPEAIAAQASAAGLTAAFMREALPDATDRTRSLAGDLIKTTLSGAGSTFSATPRTPEEIADYSDALADMLSAYLEKLVADGWARSSTLPIRPTDTKADR